MIPWTILLPTRVVGVRNFYKLQAEFGCFVAQGIFDVLKTFSIYWFLVRKLNHITDKYLILAVSCSLLDHFIQYHLALWFCL